MPIATHAMHISGKLVAVLTVGICMQCSYVYWTTQLKVGLT